jgi:hypothetical protein
MSRMTVEKARELRDEKRDGKHRQRPAAFVPQPGTRKHRELRFDHRHPEHVDEARKLLAGLDGMEIDDGIAPTACRSGTKSATIPWKDSKPRWCARASISTTACTAS